MGSRVQCNVCWRSLAIETGSTESGETVVPEAEADQGVALVIVMPAVPRVDRRRYVTKRDLVKYGYTDECQACTQLASNMHNAMVPHDDRCRDRIGERMMSRTTVDVENEISCPEAGEEVDVGEPTVVEDQRSYPQSTCHSQFHSQFPQFEWVDHQAQEPDPE